jgi:cell division protease FtsH
MLTWWLIGIGLLLLWNLFSLPQNSRQAELPYSTFLQQVRDGNVASVHLVGSQITGTLKHPYALPAPAASPGRPASPPPQVTEFHTVFPQAVTDPTLIANLEAHGVTIDVSDPTPPWYLGLLGTWGPLIAFTALILWMNARAAGGVSSQLGFGKAKPHRYESDQPKVTFDDVAGADEAKQALQEEVDFLRDPDKYHRLGAHIPRGVLLVGSPGTGKTLMARAVAGEAGVPFLSLNASEFVELFVGVGASRVRDLFEQAKKVAPAIVFIDELDAVGRRRGAGIGATNDEREQTLNQLLGELDGFDPRANIIVLAATNRPDVLDPALLRPGRFDRQVTIDLPDRRGREAILRIHVRDIPLAPDVDLAAIAGITVGLSGAELENLCNEAALSAARHGHDQVTMADFEEAHDRLRLGVARPHLVDDNERRVVAYHEAGHAVVAWFTPYADPVRKVTIVPHGQALGVTEQLPDIERHNLSQTDLDARLAVMLGGRSAEEIVFDQITTGAESDLVSATQLARRMVTRWGMGELGAVAFQSDEQQPFLGYEMAQGRDYSEETAARIDRAVHSLLDGAHEKARTALRGARDRLESLAETLLHSETVEFEELERILGPRLVPEPTTSTAR